MTYNLMKVACDHDEGYLLPVLVPASPYSFLLPWPVSLGVDEFCRMLWLLPVARLNNNIMCG